MHPLSIPLSIYTIPYLYIPPIYIYTPQTLPQSVVTALKATLPRPAQPMLTGTTLSALFYCSSFLLLCFCSLLLSFPSLSFLSPFLLLFLSGTLLLLHLLVFLYTSHELYFFLLNNSHPLSSYTLPMPLYPPYTPHIPPHAPHIPPHIPPSIYNIGEEEECNMTEVDMSQFGQGDARQGQSATDEDDEEDGRGGGQRVQCAHQ